jgi:hypothetical protein
LEGGEGSKMGTQSMEGESAIPNGIMEAKEMQFLDKVWTATQWILATAIAMVIAGTILTYLGAFIVSLMGKIEQRRKKRERDSFMRRFRNQTSTADKDNE